MSGLEAGFRYPDIVREGIQLVLDSPVDVQIRVDPDGEKEAGTIRLQWLDTSYEPVWRDTTVYIDLEKRRFHQIEGWLIGRQHHGSGAIGVALFAAPVLAVISPYLYVRSKLYRSKERKHGMSRHGIALLGKLKGQLDAETEALLVRVLKNEWERDRKLSRQVRYEEALELLQHCDLTVRVMLDEHADPPVLLGDFLWHDDEGDLLAHFQFVGDRLHFGHVLRTEFEEPQARLMIDWHRSIRIISEEED